MKKDYVKDWSARAVEEAAQAKQSQSQKSELSPVQHVALARRLKYLEQESRSLQVLVDSTYKGARVSKVAAPDFKHLHHALSNLRCKLDDRCYLEGVDSPYYGDGTASRFDEHSHLEQVGSNLNPKQRAVRLFLFRIARLARPSYQFGREVYFLTPRIPDQWVLNCIRVVDYSGDAEIAGDLGAYFPRIAANHVLSKLPETVSKDWQKALGVSAWAKPKGEFELTCTPEELSELSAYSLRLLEAMEREDKRLEAHEPNLPHCGRVVAPYLWSNEAEQRYKRRQEANRGVFVAGGAR